jgi:hypothetical protein
MSAAQQQKIRRIVWTGAIASVTATGAWYGAGLKTKSELNQVIPSFLFQCPYFITSFLR